MGDFDFLDKGAKPPKQAKGKTAGDKPAKGSKDAGPPTEVKKAVAKKEAKKAKDGGGFDPSVFLSSGVPSTMTGPKMAKGSTARLADAARSTAASRQRELRGKTIPRGR